jgi:hypothetical protein
MKTLLSLIFALFLVTPALAQEWDVEARPALSPGQVWTIEVEGQAAARLTIQRIERWGELEAVHVSLTGVSGPPGINFNGEIGHLPFERSALENSLGELVGTDGLMTATFEDGYAEWQAANGVVFTLPVAEVIDVIFGLHPEG